MDEQMPSLVTLSHSLHQTALTPTPTLVANVDGVGSDAKNGDGRTLSERQRADPDLAAIIDYQQAGVGKLGQKFFPFVLCLFIFISNLKLHIDPIHVLFSNGLQIGNIE